MVSNIAASDGRRKVTHACTTTNFSQPRFTIEIDGALTATQTKWRSVTKV